MAVETMVRCKFKCTSSRKYQGWNGDGKFFYEYEMNAVSSGSDENKEFFASTPSGSLKVSAVASDLFEPGQEYYLDITKA